MKIDKALVGGELSPIVLSGLIKQYAAKNELKFKKLRKYYRGEHDILFRKRLSESCVNNKVVANHAKYITDLTTAYLVGAPVTYSAANGFDIETVKDCYFEQTIAKLDSELEKTMSIYGRAYEMVYANSEAQPRSCLLQPENTFVVYDDTAEGNKLYGVHFYNHRNIDGTEGYAEAVVADSERIYTYTNERGNFDVLRLTDVREHYFGVVPVIEYINNSEKQGDFEQQISLIDAYNTLLSDRINDKEQFVDAFLLLVNIELDSEDAKRLKEERILEGVDEKAKAEYLSKTLNEADTEVLRGALKEDIHRFSMVPDLSDENFVGNLSGVAIKYKLMGFEQFVKNKERLFEKGLKERFVLYNNFLNVKKNMALVPAHKIDVEFKRNLPVNELELSQMINNFNGIISTETLLSRVPFITDAKEEYGLLEAERLKEENYAIHTQ